jgi:DMSO/TMAO reductase YedYZ heme-binding membrane subunit
VVGQTGRHRAVRPRSVVNAGYVALRAWPAVLALTLLWPAVHGRLAAVADPVIGFDAALCLVACLAVTPVITVVRAPVARLRWWYGNWVFVLALAGLLIHLVNPPGSVAFRVAGNAVDWTGTLIVVLLLPMAVTSSVVAQRLLGPEWKRWQRSLVWFVWAFVAVHLLLTGVWLVAGGFLAATLPFVAVRQPRVKKEVKAWRVGGYSTGGWWAVLAVLAVIVLSGVSVLVAGEVVAVARAFA